MQKQFFSLFAALGFVAFSATLLAQPAPHRAPAPNGTPTPEPTSTPTEVPTEVPAATPTPMIAPTAAPQKPIEVARGETRGAQLLAEKSVRVGAELLDGFEVKPLTARFAVAPDGTAAASLLGSSGSRRVDTIVLNQIKSWRFSAALEDGKAVASTVKLRVVFAQN